MSEATNMICPKCDSKFHTSNLNGSIKCLNCKAWLEWDLKSIEAANAVDLSDGASVSKWQDLLDLPKERKSNRTPSSGKGKDAQSDEIDSGLNTWDPSRQISADAQAIIRSQDRTTHAVRALSVFFFMNLLWGSVVVVLASWANLIPPQVHCVAYEGCTKEQSGIATFLIFIAFILALIGVVATIRASLKELLLSRLTSTRM